LKFVEDDKFRYSRSSINICRRGAVIVKLERPLKLDKQSVTDQSQQKKLQHLLESSVHHIPQSVAPHLPVAHLTFSTWQSHIFITAWIAHLHVPQFKTQT